MSGSKLQSSLKDGGHFQLLQLVGEWSGVSRTFFEPGVLGDESAIQAHITPMFDGRFVNIVYESSMQGSSLQGSMIIGLYLLDNSWQMAWVDTFHMGTGIMHAKGANEGNEFNVLGQYSSGGENPEFWGWRTIIKKAADQLIISAFNISPQGQEDLAIEMTLKLHV